MKFLANTPLNFTTPTIVVLERKEKKKGKKREKEINTHNTQ